MDIGGALASSGVTKMIDVIINSPWFPVYTIPMVFFTVLGVTVYLPLAWKRDDYDAPMILAGARLMIYGPIWPVVVAYLVLFRLIPMIIKDARLKERVNWS